MEITFLNEATRDEVLMHINHLRDDADFTRVSIGPLLPKETQEHSDILYYGATHETFDQDKIASCVYSSRSENFELRYVLRDAERNVDRVDWKTTARYSQSTYSSWKAAVSARHTPPATASRPTHPGKLLSVVDTHRPLQPVDLLILESCCQCSTHTARYNQSTYSSWKAAVSGRHTPPATASRPTHPGKLLSVLDTHRPLQPVDLLFLESCCQCSTHTARYSQSTYSSWKAAVSGRRTAATTLSRPRNAKRFTTTYRASPTNHWN